MRVWFASSPPENHEYDAWVFEYTTGRCWDVVKWMSEARQVNNIPFICCFNTNWGLTGTPLHCIVDSTGSHWFSNDYEMVKFLKDFSGGT